MERLFTRHDKVALISSTVKWCEDTLKGSSNSHKSICSYKQNVKYEENPTNSNTYNEVLYSLTSKQFETLLEKVRLNKIPYRELVIYFLINPNSTYISQFDFYKVLTRMDLNCSIHRVIELCSIEMTYVNFGDTNMMNSSMPDLKLDTFETTI